jgi:hypothetical protein
VVPSSSPTASVPLLLNATAQTVSGSGMTMWVPLETFHRYVLPSKLPVASVVPLALKATAVMYCLPGTVRGPAGAPADAPTFHRYVLPWKSPVASIEPSGLNASAQMPAPAGSVKVLASVAD